jgi:glycosyltransferase 2 family protein
LFKFSKIDLHILLGNIKSADKRLLLLAFSISSLNYVFCLWRWNMLLKAAGVKLPLKRVIISFCGGIFFSLFLPSTIGGDITRSLDLGVHTKKPREIVATVFLDRLSGYVGLVIVVLFSLFLGWGLVRDDRKVLISVAIITAFLVVILAVLFNKFLFSKVNKILDSPKAGRVREAIKNLHEEMHIFRHKKKVILNNIFLSLLIQAVGPIAFYITSLSLGINKEIIYFFIFLPIIGAITLLPISIGGLGVRENMTVLFFAKAGIDQNSAVAISLLNFLFLLVYGAIGGLIYVLTVHNRRLQCNQSSAFRETRQ